MRGKTDKIQYLYKKYLNGTISGDELEEILDYFKVYGIPPEIEHIWMEEISRPSSDISIDIKDMTDRVEKRLAQKLPHSRSRTIMKRFFPYAAAMLIILMVGILYMTIDSRSSSPNISLGTVDGLDIFPADEKATILISDGRRVALDGNRNGIIIDGQQITYNDGASPILEISPADLEHITIQTPRGGTYRVMLPDSTLVWLNAETTLTYPAAFNGEERVVNLVGEAYFSIPRRRSTRQEDTYVPFKVVSSTQTVEVLGTSFNISAYADEKQTKTTLVSGKVSVHLQHQDEAVILHPGEQAWTDQTHHTKKIKVDVGDYIDWKNGEFVFRNEATQEVMLRIARWYDIELEYSSEVLTDERFSGSISRYDNLHTVLDIMEEASDLNFEVNGRTVAIGKKAKK